MRIPATEIQVLELRAEGYIEDDETPTLAYDGGWYFETSTWSARATDSQAADALLERVLVLESEVLDLQHRAQLGDALQQALQAQQLVDQLESSFVVEDLGPTGV